MTKHFESLDEIRDEIDRLDDLLVPLLVQRQKAVGAAAAFKQSREGVVVTKRIDAIADRVAGLAEKEGGDPAFMADLYRCMIACFIAHEEGEWDKRHAL